MRSVKIIAFTILVGGMVLATTAFVNKKLLSGADDKGFAVVELFTSEGCSSCPPADDLVARIQKESDDKPVYILAFHVDYWNRLGWKDQFSSADYSTRQQNYARYLHIQSVYTPQIVVNGKTEFVGSEEKTLRNAIKSGLQTKPGAQLELKVHAIDHGLAKLNYKTGDVGTNMVLLLAVLQKNAQTKVLSGENGGHTLSHVQIVREFKQVPLTGENGDADITLPVGFNSKQWEIIGVLQNKTSGAITGAARVRLTDQL